MNPAKGIVIAAIVSLSAIGATLASDGQKQKEEKRMSITREIYEGFQRNELERWHAVIAPDVILDSPGLREPIQGIDKLKNWAAEFLKALKPRIDLIDEYEGEGRAFLTVNLNWKHVEPFFGVQPTGREGTSVETFILTIENGKVTKFLVADQSLDLALYLWERGWPQGHNKRPEAIVRGIDR
jgi:hypothetical protein